MSIPIPGESGEAEETNRASPNGGRSAARQTRLAADQRQRKSRAISERNGPRNRLARGGGRLAAGRE